MLNHYLVLKFKKDMNEAEKRISSFKIKKEVEGLHDKFPGLVSIRVENLLLPSSNADIMIFARLESEDILNKYLDSPIYLHVKDLVGSVVEHTCIIDFYD